MHSSSHVLIEAGGFYWKFRSILLNLQWSAVAWFCYVLVWVEGMRVQRAQVDLECRIDHGAPPCHLIHQAQVLLNTGRNATHQLRWPGYPRKRTNRISHTLLEARSFQLADRLMIVESTQRGSGICLTTLKCLDQRYHHSKAPRNRAQRQMLLTHRLTVDNARQPRRHQRRLVRR